MQTFVSSIINQAALNRKTLETRTEARAKLHTQVFDDVLMADKKYAIALAEFGEALLKAAKPNQADPAASQLWQEPIASIAATKKLINEAMKELVRKELDVSEMVNAMLGKDAGSE